MDELVTGTRIDIEALNREGRVLFEAERFLEARSVFALAARMPAARGAALNVAQCDLRLGLADKAAAAARRLLAEDHAFAPAWEVLAEALAASGNHAEALETLQHGVALVPGAAPLWRRLGDLQQRAKTYEAARTSYEQASRRDPGDLHSLAALVALKRALYDWDGLEVLSSRVRASVLAGHGAIQPLAFLAEGAAPAEQRLCAEAWIRTRVKRSRDLPARIRSTGQPRIGFVSYGFGAHPTVILTSAVIEAMCGMGADLHLFCTGPNDATAYRTRLEASAPVYDVADLDPYALSERIRGLGVDLLVDLDGYSRERLPSVFALRPARLQLAWLGFPGTTGGEFFDFVIADRFVLPPWLATHFTEPVAWLPRCYQPNDPTRVIAAPAPRRVYGLPEHGMVYACFNTPQKIDPRSFARMARVLRSVEGSVLWLLEGPGEGTSRLREEAEKEGISPERLVFMARAGHADYLSAYRHADLFLDTEHYNAHTTASDAMWAGCPVLTRPGVTFASRVAGSLNHHAGLESLNATDDDAFVAKAIRFAQDPAFRRDILKRLELARRQSPLFDATGFARDLLGLFDRLLAGATSGTN